MKRSESDRFIADRSGRESEVSAQVYVIVTDDGRRGVSISRRYLALAIAIAAVAAAIVVTSLESGDGRGGSSVASVPRSARSTSAPPVASTSGSSCVDVGGYGGLGGRLGAFDANNNDSTGAAGPSSGTAFYVVTAIARGCVTAFAVQDSTSPPLTARGLLCLVSRPFLPGDAERVLNADRCAVWKSRALLRATGRAYARATATTQAGNVPGTARITATAQSTC
jgi:hypothetical protein